MAQLHPLSPSISVGSQVWPADIPSLAADGFTSIINNRPDGEEAGQPSSADIEAAAQMAGLNYLHVPVSGMPDGQVAAVLAARLKVDASHDTRTFMFCRSGMRSAAAWAMAQRLDGSDADDLRAVAAAAGYDLSRLPL